MNTGIPTLTAMVPRNSTLLIEGAICLETRHLSDKHVLNVVWFWRQWKLGLQELKARKSSSPVFIRS